MVKPFDTATIFQGDKWSDAEIWLMDRGFSPRVLLSSLGIKIEFTEPRCICCGAPASQVQHD